MKRFFISVNLPKLAQKELGKLIEKLEKFHWPVRWEKPEKIHLTLAFLGQLDQVKLPIGQKAVALAAQEIKPFAVSFKGLGAFPDFIKPRIVWVGLKGDLKSLAALQKSIRSELKKAGLWFDEKPFIPHLTIGRVKRGMSKGALLDLGKKIGQMRKIDFKNEILVDRVAMMKSELRRTGSVYKLLTEFKL